MRRLPLTLLFLASLAAAAAISSLEPVPGYMDAEYYYAGALRIFAGQGASEPYLWNYLNGVHTLPAPSFAYWMPLTSLLAAAGMALTGSAGFWSARLGFILLAALLPPLTAWMAYRLTGQAALAWLSGLFALFSGFYLAYVTTTDAFPIYMVLGSLFLVVAGGVGESGGLLLVLRFTALGGLVGLMHMARADGLLWLLGVALVGLEELRCRRNPSGELRWRKVFPRLALHMTAALFGYVLVAAPWMLRNLNEWGSLLPPGGSRALWITDYPQTMRFPADSLTIAHWLSAGWGAHIQAWFLALGNYLQTIVAVQSSVVLFPFILIGMWKLRRRIEVRLGAAMGLLNLLVMTFVFPYAGVNGGFFHSGAALQLLFWAAAPLGIQAAVEWYSIRRRFATSRKMYRFTVWLVLTACAVLTAGVTYNRVVGSDAAHWEWSAGNRHYRETESALLAHGANPTAPVLVNNPPGYWLASGRPALVIPAGDEQMLLAAARQFQAGYLVLETTNPVELADFYFGRVSPAQLEYLAMVGETKLYRFNWDRTE